MRAINSLSKGLRILEYIAASDRGARVAQIARVLDLPRSNLTLYLNSLTEAGYAVRNPADGRYYLTDKLEQLATSGGPNRYSRLVDAAWPEMQRLHDQFDENVMICVLSLFKLKIVGRIQSTRSVQIVHDESLYLPHVTAGGKAMLAVLPPSVIDRYFRHTPMQRFTPRSLVRREDVRLELELVRTRGYAVNHAEFEAEVMAVGAPVFQAGQVFGALVLQFPTHRHREEELEFNADTVVSACKRIDERLASEAPGQV